MRERKREIEIFPGDFFTHRDSGGHKITQPNFKKFSSSENDRNLHSDQSNQSRFTYGVTRSPQKKIRIIIK